MKLKTILFFMGCTISGMAYTRIFSGEYIAEWQWTTKNKRIPFGHPLVC
ncbi:hypothetical protein [Bacteroides acidifaciens]|nr:hypothetical protein [Bacteroides acidifaciens]